MRKAGKKPDSDDRLHKEDKNDSETLSNLNNACLQSLLRISQYPFKNMVEFLDYVLNEALAFTGSKIGYIYHYNEKKKEFVLNSWSNEVHKECSITNKQTTYLLETTGIWGEAVRQRRPVIINDFQADNSLKKGFPAGHAPLFKFITLPVIIKNMIVAVIGLANKEADYDETDVLQLTLMMDSVWKIADQKKTEKELYISNEKLKIALDTGNIGIWELNLITDEVIWDERIENMFGLKPGIFGKTLKAFENLLNEEDVTHFQKALSESLTSDLPFETIFRIRSENGKTKYISTKALVKKDRDGKPTSLTGVCFDITSMREGTEQLVLKLNEELLRSNKELQSFAYVASHDLQEPLRMISSFTQLLSQKYGDKLDSDAHDYIRFAIDGSKRMYDLINDLLAYSRIQSRGGNFSELDLCLVIKKVVKNLDLQMKDKNIHLSIDDLPLIIADEGQMLQLMQNLVGNAIKFSADNKTIYIGAQLETDNYIFSVKDEGIGIESQHFERIFQIFQRLHPRGEYEGTGIGLAICKRIVERHGGRIWVESIPDLGSTFYFTIPKKNQEALN